MTEGDLRALRSEQARLQSAADRAEAALAALSQKQQEQDGTHVSGQSTCSLRATLFVNTKPHGIR